MRSPLITRPVLLKYDRLQCSSTYPMLLEHAHCRRRIPSVDWSCAPSHSPHAAPSGAGAVRPSRLHYCYGATTFCVLRAQTLGPSPFSSNPQPREPKEREGSNMIPWPFDGKSLPRSGSEKSLDSQFEIVAEGFLELFELLEEYAPIWYTEDHHQRALTAWRILQKAKLSPD